jgi:SOS-response transcriptional repressor LexA
MKYQNKLKEFEKRNVDHFGEVGAGRVVPFTPRDGKHELILPINSPADEHLGLMRVRGRSLEDENIYDGDVLICRKNITNRDINRNTICIVFIRSTGELVAKKIRFGHLGNQVTLVASGGNIPDQHYDANDIEVRAIAFRVQRDLITWDRMDGTYGAIPL